MSDKLYPSSRQRPRRAGSELAACPADAAQQSVDLVRGDGLRRATGKTIVRPAQDQAMVWVQELGVFVVPVGSKGVLAI